MKRIASVFIVVVSFCMAQGLYAQTSLVQQGKNQLKNKQYQTAFSTFKKAAAGGSAEAMYYYGLCYENGYGTQRDIYEAMEWYLKAADKGDGEACRRVAEAYRDDCVLYVWYERDSERNSADFSRRSAQAGCASGAEIYAWIRLEGEYCETNASDALGYFQRAAASGNEDAMCDLGQIYYFGYGGVSKDMAKSRQYLDMLKGTKTARGYNQLAFMYWDGSAGVKSENEAYKLWLKSANMGDAYSEVLIAYMYLQKRTNGVLTKSEQQGRAWLERAYNHGYTLAARDLGDYYKGKKQYSEAFKWYYKAGYVYEVMSIIESHGNVLSQSDIVAKLKHMASKGVFSAQKMLGEMYDNGNRVQKSQNDAFKWYKAAANNWQSKYYDSGELFNRLGNMYFRGEGTTQSHSEAFKWYSRGATCTHESGWPLHNMGDCYAGGFGVAKKEYEAFNCYKKSAGTNNISAMNRVATCCLLGRGTSKNGSEAFKWAKKSADYGDMEGQYVLAICYYLGEGTQRNVGLAREYMSKSANQGFAQAKADLSKISSQQTAYNTNPNDIYKQGMEMINNMYKQASNVSTETLIKWGEAAQRQGGTYDNSNTYNNSSSSSSSPTRVTCPRCNGKRYHPESYTDCADIYSYNNQAGTTCYICGQVTKHCHYPCLTCQSRGTVEKY